MTTSIINTPQPAPMAQPPGLAELHSAVAPTAFPNLAAALALARDRCKAASKDKENTFHKFWYASADEVIATAKAAMEGSGLSLVPTLDELIVVGSGTMAFYALNRVLMLAHSSGEFLVLMVRGWPVVPDRGRPLDKAYAVALTSSLAYKFRDLLQMPRGDEHDVSAQDDTQTPLTPSPVQAAAANKPQPQAAPATPARMSEASRQILLGLYREKGRTPQDVERMLASRNLKAMEQLPQSLVVWAMSILADGQITVEQSDNITSLVNAKRIAWDSINARLMKRYGVDRLSLLTQVQAQEVEESFTAKEAVPAA